MLKRPLAGRASHLILILPRYVIGARLLFQAPPLHRRLHAPGNERQLPRGSVALLLPQTGLGQWDDAVPPAFNSWCVAPRGGSAITRIPDYPLTIADGTKEERKMTGQSTFSTGVSGVSDTSKGSTGRGRCADGNGCCDIDIHIDRLFAYDTAVK